MRYMILRVDTVYWHNQDIYAQLRSPYDMQVAIALWKPEPFAKDPQEEYTVNGKAPLPDLLGTGSITWLMSEKLLGLLRNAGVEFESFPVKLYDRKSTVPVAKQYGLFHLLSVQPMVDLERSNITRSDDVERIELLQLGRDAPAMARDNYLDSLVFVREDLYNRIVKEGITGCWWQDPQKYQFILH